VCKGVDRTCEYADARDGEDEGQPRDAHHGTALELKVTGVHFSCQDNGRAIGMMEIIGGIRT
jgi:hypothetical protein